jgi:hypothetical protein
MEDAIDRTFDEEVELLEALILHDPDLDRLELS